ncbi:MAG: carboxypeptidase-like regulatory domain-containing protein, partial [Verrucomicrobiota bacterium]
MSSFLEASTRRGQVTDSGTSVGIERVTVQLDLLPTNGVFEYSTETDPFGFFTLDGIAAGTYELSTDHPGYLPYLETNVFNGANTVQDSFSLDPIIPGGGFEIFVHVSGISSGARLENTPVTAYRFELQGDLTPSNIITTLTDSNGVAILRGMEDGFYRFTANLNGSPIPRWLSHTTEGTAEDKKLLNQAHMVNFLLKPGPLQSLTVNVEGFDPVDQSVKALDEYFVELEGLDPQDLENVLIPARTTFTDTSGDALFQRLPGIPWRITAKHIGYQALTNVVMPDASGNLPATVNLNVTLKANDLRFFLFSPYHGHATGSDPFSFILSGLDVRL